MLLIISINNKLADYNTEEDECQDVMLLIISINNKLADPRKNGDRLGL